MWKGEKEVGRGLKLKEVRARKASRVVDLVRSFYL